jgi:putative hydrolase of the HAD superfamily
LLSNGWDRRLRQAAVEKFGLDEEETEERHHLTFDSYEEGKLSLDEYLGRVVFYQNRGFTLEDLKAFIFAGSFPKPEMIELFSRLKEKYRLKVATVSNEGRELTTYRIQRFNLGTLVDFFISSCFVHLRKPDLDIYRLALDCAQVPPEQVIYIDDRPLFVEVATGLGIQGIHHVDYESTRVALATLGPSL